MASHGAAEAATHGAAAASHGGDGDCGNGEPSKRSEKKLKQMGQRLVKEDAKIRIKRVWGADRFFNLLHLSNAVQN